MRAIWEKYAHDEVESVAGRARSISKSIGRGAPSIATPATSNAPSPSPPPSPSPTPDWVSAAEVPSAGPTGVGEIEETWNGLSEDDRERFRRQAREEIAQDPPPTPWDEQKTEKKQDLCVLHNSIPARTMNHVNSSPVPSVSQRVPRRPFTADTATRSSARPRRSKTLPGMPQPASSRRPGDGLSAGFV